MRIRPFLDRRKQKLERKRNPSASTSVASADPELLAVLLRIAAALERLAGKRMNS
jgi:hypothetical protein